MNALKKASVVVIIALVFLSGLVGCSKKNGATWGSSYSVDYKITGEYEFSYASVEATVKGPAAKLAVILTNPEGKSNSSIIEKDQMISNSQTVRLPMQEPQVGTWVLAVKTVDPEKVVWKKDILFSLGQLTIKDVKFDFEQEGQSYELRKIKIAVKKDGNLPVKFEPSSLTFDGREFTSGELELENPVMVDQEATLDISFYWRPALKPGERHLVKGKLSYSKDKSLDFEKEFVVPENNTQKTGEQNTNNRRRTRN